MISLKDMGFDQDQLKEDMRALTVYTGGEENGLKRLEEFIHITKNI
mgnify:CR=1 FL=1